MKNNNHYLEMTCTRETFQPIPAVPVRWWRREDWAEMHRGCLHFFRPHPPWARKDWNDLYDQGWQYCSTMEKGRPTAIAGLWRKRVRKWEVITAGDKEAFHRKNRDKALISFITQYILDAGRTARITVRQRSRLAKAAQAVGYSIEKPRKRS